MKTQLKRLSIFLASLAFSFFMGTSTLQASGIKIYVSVKGNDVNPGTEIHPVATLNTAVERIRKMKLSGDLKGPVEVIIGGGEYHPAKPFVLESGDSGSESSPLIFRAAKDEIPVFSGSIPLKNWKILMNKALLQTLDPEAAGKVYVTDLKEQGISDFGDPTLLGARPDLICNGSLQTLARWPNEGFTHAGKVNGQTEMPPTYIKKRGTKEGIFEYNGDRQSRWINESDIRLSGYWYWDWSEEFQKVESVDASTKNLKIKEPYHKYGYRDSLRYFGLNIFCEMDRPGEYYLDRSSGLLYWFPPEGINPNREKVTLTYFGDPFMIEIRDCSYVTLHGLSFSESRGSAIRITGGDHCLIEDCLIERVGRDGIHVDGGTDHGISGCLLSQLGCSGIHMSGGDRRNLASANHFIEHTIVEHFSVFKKTYEPAVHLSGCGIRISNNRFRYSSSSAMRLEGNDFLIEYNQVSHVVNESDDQGGIDMFNNPSYQGNVIRYNHWSDIYGGTRHGAAGVRLDDMISGVVVYGNIFERCGARDFGGVQIHGGKDNVIDNNLFFDCNAAVSFSPWSEERWLTQLESPQIRKKLYEEVDIRSDLYRQRYPNLDSLRQHPNLNTITNNLIVICKNHFLKKNFRQNESNNTSIAAEGNGIIHFYNQQVLKKYGLNPIPFNKIGPAKNKWEKME